MCEHMEKKTVAIKNGLIYLSNDIIVLYIISYIIVVAIVYAFIIFQVVVQVFRNIITIR